MEGDKKDALVQPPPEVQGKARQAKPCHATANWNTSIHETTIHHFKTPEKQNPILRPAPAGGSLRPTIRGSRPFGLRKLHAVLCEMPLLLVDQLALRPDAPTADAQPTPAFDSITPADRRQRHAWASGAPHGRNGYTVEATAREAGRGWR